MSTVSVYAGWPGQPLTEQSEVLDGPVTGSTTELVWVPDERLLAVGVRQWSEMPLWRTHAGGEQWG